MSILQDPFNNPTFGFVDIYCIFISKFLKCKALLCEVGPGKGQIEIRSQFIRQVIEMIPEWEIRPMF